MRLKFILLYHLIYSYLLNVLLKLHPNLKYDFSVRFKGRPRILIHSKARIKIGKNTVINSVNFGYHLQMHSPVKLYADRANAIIDIGSNTRINGSCIHAFKKITIGDNCLIAANTQIIDANGHELMMHQPESRIQSSDNGNEIQIGNNVWIGANCIILGGTKIGDGSVIAAGSIVRGRLDSKGLYGGNPATLIKQY
jgi:acetyltransferase-like isoleucine patch superfamily enzyme